MFFFDGNNFIFGASYKNNMLGKGKWKSLAWYYVTHPGQLKKLADEVDEYVSKDGLRKVRDDVFELTSYVQDVVTGKYKHYNLTSLVMIVAAFVYLVTPADVIPDILPTGLVDDAAVIVWVMRRVMGELERYRASKGAENSEASF